MAINITREVVEDFQDELAAGVGGLPPGYIEGFRPVLLSNLTVEVGGGVTSVQGSAVYMQEQILTQQMWHSPYTGGSEGFYYYVYLTVQGEYKVDFTKPVFSGSYYYYAHPAFGWRVILRLWIDSDDVIKFVSREFRDTPRIVTVAPDGFVGEADYYCDGADDQIWLTAACDYADEVRLYAGSYYINANLAIAANTILRGSGFNTVLYPTDNISAKWITLATADVTLTNLQLNVPVTWAGAGDPEIYVSAGGTRIVLDHIKFDADYQRITAATNTIDTEAAGSVTVRNCFFNYGIVSFVSLTSVMFTGNDCYYLRIVSNATTQAIFSNNILRAGKSPAYNRLSPGIGIAGATIGEATNNAFLGPHFLYAFGIGTMTISENTADFFDYIELKATGTQAGFYSVIGNNISGHMITDGSNMTASYQPTLDNKDIAWVGADFDHDTATEYLPGKGSGKHPATGGTIYLDSHNATRDADYMGSGVIDDIRYKIWIQMKVTAGETPANIVATIQGYDGSAWQDVDTDSPASTDEWEELELAFTGDVNYEGYSVELTGAEEYYIGDCVWGPVEAKLIPNFGGTTIVKPLTVGLVETSFAVIKENSWQAATEYVAASITITPAMAGTPLLVDPSAAAVTITLPSPATTKGLPFHIANRHYGYGLVNYGDCESAAEPILVADDGEDNQLDSCTFARSDTVAHGDTHSFKMVMSSGGTSSRAHIHDVTADLHGLTASQTYTVTGWMYVPTTGGPSAFTEVRFIVYDTTNTAELGRYQAAAYDTWRRFSITFTIPASCSVIDIYAWIGSTAATGEFIYVDDIQLYRHYDVTVSGPIEDVVSYTLGNEGDSLTIESDGDKYLETAYHAHGYNVYGMWHRTRDGMQFSHGHATAVYVDADTLQVTVTLPVAFLSTDYSIMVNMTATTMTAAEAKVADGGSGAPASTTTFTLTLMANNVLDAADTATFDYIVEGRYR